MDCDEHLLAMAADGGHSGDAGDAHPDLEPDPDPGPGVGVVGLAYDRNFPVQQGEVSQKPR